MYKLILKLLFYSAVAYALSLIGIVSANSLIAPLLFAVNLTIVNTSLRPLVSAVALALNLITFGLASVGANMLMIMLANAVFTQLAGLNFGALVIFAVLVMVCDYCIAKLTKNKYYKTVTQ